MSAMSSRSGRRYRLLLLTRRCSVDTDTDREVASAYRTISKPATCTRLEGNGPLTSPK